MQCHFCIFCMGSNTSAGQVEKDVCFKGFGPTVLLLSFPRRSPSSCPLSIAKTSRSLRASVCVSSYAPFSILLHFLLAFGWLPLSLTKNLQKSWGSGAEQFFSPNFAKKKNNASLWGWLVSSAFWLLSYGKGKLFDTLLVVHILLPAALRKQQNFSNGKLTVLESGCLLFLCKGSLFLRKPFNPSFTLEEIFPAAFLVKPQGWLQTDCIFLYRFEG